MTEEYEEVEAELIEPDGMAIAVSVIPAAITADFKAVREKVESLTKPYEGITADGINGMELAQMRRCHAELNEIEHKINDAKIAVKKQYEAPYKAFEAEVKEIMRIVQEPRQLIKACIADKERGIKDGRKEHLREVYHQFLDDNGLPSFAENVDFDVICPEKLWNTSAKSYKEREAENELCDRVAQVMKEWRSFQTVKGKLFDPEYSERVFWKSLSAIDAMSADAEQKERQDAVNAIHEELRCYEEEAPVRYQIACSMTNSQRDKVIAYFKQIGVSGTIRKDC